MKIILVKLFLLVIVCYGDEDLPCFEHCVPKETCASYNAQLANLTRLNKCSCEYKRLLTDLKGLICNKKEGKVCCNAGDTIQTSSDPSSRFAIENYECGLRKVGAANIAGGEGTRPGEWPWMARLMYPNTTQVMCAGTLVTRRHVVTAAHCVMKVRPDIVRLGDTILSTEYDCLYPDFCKPEVIKEDDFYGSEECYREDQCAPKHVDIGVKEVVSHESFSLCHPDADTSCFPQFDVALVTMESPVTLSSFIQPVCLPDIGASIKYIFLVVTGWGNSDREVLGFEQPDVLQKLDVTHGNNEVSFLKASKRKSNGTDHIHQNGSF